MDTSAFSLLIVPSCYAVLLGMMGGGMVLGLSRWAGRRGRRVGGTPGRNRVDA